jgi:hypothetical protein
VSEELTLATLRPGQECVEDEARVSDLWFEIGRLVESNQERLRQVGDNQVVDRGRLHVGQAETDASFSDGLNTGIEELCVVGHE